MLDSPKVDEQEGKHVLVGSGERVAQPDRSMPSANAGQKRRSTREVGGKNGIFEEDFRLKSPLTACISLLVKRDASF